MTVSGFTFVIRKLNSFENLFDGDRKTFPITKTIGAVETPITISLRKDLQLKLQIIL